MSLLAVLRVAVRALLRNKLRSFLTMLGVVIGVGAVIAMVAIGEGAKKKVEDAFASMGSNLLIVMSGTSTSGGAHGGFGSQPTLTWDDLKAIQAEVPGVRAAAPALTAAAQLMSDTGNWSTRVTGTTPAYFDLRDWPLARGTPLGDADLDGGAKVVILGQTVVDKLYGPGVDPLGQTVRIRNVPFLVQGVLARKGQSPVGQDYDDAAFVPATTFRAKIQGGLGNYINGVVFVGASSPEGTARVQRAVAALLRERHHLAAGTDDDFSIRNLQEMASAMEAGTSTLTTLLAAIAAVSLLVGGIGIMNIMLVSVTERTREIGVRMAVGARPQHILAQFLVEALSLSLMGGLIGLVVGLAASALIGQALVDSSHNHLHLRQERHDLFPERSACG